ncbi:unnamed protein product [Rotaria socialis]|uniref:Phosphate transporter n=1 Tax=Rotaria socialis TaxID=392032 RepID=A0A818UF02_9BILA|nr:unnamed protein product [Rotaria socialis]CAF3595235.1 unnamed protein product [Rotaria socialis]CAF3627146.1 unnamed protein product [Rotaria socialis]CAF3696208.1 unnamed protein product [Rotaria socialis]
MVSFEPYSPDLLWILIIGFIIAFVLAFGIGANDVANSFGTSVGSKVLTLRQACILATIFEILGSILIGAKVSDTIRKGIIDPLLFENPKELMLGQISSLLGCCIWLLVATFFNLPVSGTHSIVGATVGFALVAHGSRGIRWIEFAKIGASWFVSPALAGIISIAVFMLIRKFILESTDQLRIGLRWLPVFYSVTIMINVFSILLSAPPLLYFDRIPLWGKFITTILVGLAVGISVMVFVKPRMRHTIEEILKKKLDLDSRGGSGGERDGEEQPKLTGTEGRFETYTVTRLENVNTVDKETQIDHISMLKEYDLIRYQQQHPDQFRPYVEMQRIRKDSETISSPGVSGALRVRRESDRYRNDPLGLDCTNPSVQQRTVPNPPVIRERTKIYRLPQSTNPVGLPGTMSNENKSLLLAAVFMPHDDNVSTTSGNQNSSTGDLDEIEDKMPEISEKKKIVDTSNDSIEIAGIFKYLQILTAIFGAFAHGGNDLRFFLHDYSISISYSNAIGPLIGLWLIYVDGSVAARSNTPLWVLFYGGLGISVGLWVWGRRVIRTIGEDLTKITPSSGFVIEISTAFTVLVASNLSIPISTTHCKVGSVVAIGRFRSKQNVDWSLFRNIIVAWIVTVPVTGGISAGVMALLRLIFL